MSIRYFFFFSSKLFISKFIYNLYINLYNNLYKFINLHINKYKSINLHPYRFANDEAITSVNALIIDYLEK